MKNRLAICTLLCLTLALCAGPAYAGKTASSGDLPSLKEIYKDDFLMGCAVSRPQLADSGRMDFLEAQFNSFTPENELKPENVFDAKISRELAAAGDETHPAVKFDVAKPMLDYAMAHGIAVHGHVLVWHSQTPKSFFTEGYREDGPLVSREVMLARLENYIASVMAYMDENYKGLVISWDVVNEAVLDKSGKLRGKKTEDDQNGTWWMDTVGEDYVLQAFTFARKYAPQGTQLYYNDYSIPYEPKLSGIEDLVQGLMDAGLIDGVGFQCHYQLNSPIARQVENAMQYFVDKGLRLRVSEMDIPISANTPAEFKKQAQRYKDLMQVFLGFAQNLESVTVWGTTDDLSWKADQYPLLFDASLTPKPAFWAWADLSKNIE
jgi:endo-1,4-beta-xylanase